MELEDFDSNFIREKIQAILDKEHKEPQKRIIKEFPERLNFACPICMDSQKKANNKRGNLYLKDLSYKCFNCDIHMSFIKLCDQFTVDINMDDRIKLYSYIDNHVKYSQVNESAVDLLEQLIDINEFVEYFNTKQYSWLIDISPVKFGSQVFNYLRNDRLIQNMDDIYQGIYRVIRDNKVVFKTPVMISLNKGKDKLLGIQLRNLETDRNKRFYKIIEFEDIYNYMNPNNKLDESIAIVYNKLSHFYNILNVNFDKPVTIFEGFIDSKFYPNSIGLVGSNNSKDILKFLTESDEQMFLQFYYDNDATGIKNATAMLKKGHPVFLWNKLFEKLLKKKGGNYYDQKNSLKHIIDLNDLVIKAKNPNIYETLKLNTFFSKDQFDSTYLDPLVFDKSSKIWRKLD